MTDDLSALWVEHRVLRQDFYTHEARVEERWKTIFREWKEYQDHERHTIEELKDRVDALYRLVITVSGTAIVLMAGWIATLIL